MYYVPLLRIIFLFKYLQSDPLLPLTGHALMKMSIFQMMIWGLQLLPASYQPYIHLTEFILVVPYQKLRNGCEHLE